jgi:3',5'-nucleoside bisphosphate phosphatase
MVPMRIDLHAHSNASDGTDTPGALMALARDASLDVVALTDHDTTGGWAEAAAALPAGLSLVRGAEFSTKFVRAGREASVHVLGYLFDPADVAVVAEQDRLRAERLGRGLAIVDRLVAAGVGITREQVLAIAGNAPVGRPHIGRALVDAKLVASVTEAFGSYLNANGRFYVAKADTPTETAIRMIAAAGGVSVVAHVRTRSAAHLLTKDRLEELAQLGLGGIEVNHPDHDDAARDELAGVARDLGLFTTGSSDYHGENKSLRLGECTTAPEVYEQIVSTATGIEVLHGD